MKTTNSFVKYAGAGFQMLGSLGFCIWLGFIADKKWDTSPIFILVGCLIGLGSSMYLLIKDVFKES